MHVFEVWAPRARTVEVKIGKNKFPLTQKQRGWWAAEVEEAGSGTDYGFVIDALEPPLPDPRAQWQPNGVHGESRVVDHAAFVWSDRIAGTCASGVRMRAIQEENSSGSRRKVTPPGVKPACRRKRRHSSTE